MAEMRILGASQENVLIFLRDRFPIAFPGVAAHGVEVPSSLSHFERF
jgi:hypothetical protein